MFVTLSVSIAIHCLRFCFVLFCFPSWQLFNEFNARSIGNKLNVWEGLHANPIFIAVIFITIGCQIFMVEVAGKFASTTGLTIVDWGWSILMGFGSVPVGLLMRFIPVKENPDAFADYYNIKPPVRAGVCVWEGGGGWFPSSPCSCCSFVVDCSHGAFVAAAVFVSLTSAPWFYFPSCVY